MCGIVGVFHRERGVRVPGDTITEMTQQLIHRGPDDGGACVFGPAALGHRRLSILDLSAAGRQPLASADRRYWISFNGEIYNFQRLRDELRAHGHTFRTRTDTEVLVELFRHEGPACLERLNGMFAFAIYDRKAHSIFLARDRVGKKPLFYWDNGECFLFASEMKAFFPHPAFDPDMEPRAIVDVLSTLYIPDPHSIYRNVKKLKPGCWMSVSSDGIRTGRYWSPPTPPAHPPRVPTAHELERAREGFDALFEDAVRLRMISDVPLGAFLSGGVDSSLVVGEMSRIGERPPLTTAIRFDHPEEDESPFAARVAEHFRCDHHTELVDADALSLIERLIWHFDEPFADASALPTYQLSKVTRSRVTVALSGDGGDEGFAGYDKYLAERRERVLRRFLPASAWAGAALVAERTLASRLDLIRRGAGLFRTLAEDPGRAYFRTQSFIAPEERDGLLDAGFLETVRDYDPSALTARAYARARGCDPITALQYTDFETFLPGDILTKVDRMSMAHSLEVRCPLLDHRIIEFGIRLPPTMKLVEKEGKWFLKKVLARRLPEELVYRPKHGFTIPVDQWFRGALIPLFEAHVMAGGLKDAGIFDMKALRTFFRAHLDRKRNHGQVLWTLLCLGVWYDSVRKPVASWTSAPPSYEVEELEPYAA